MEILKPKTDSNLYKTPFSKSTSVQILSTSENINNNNSNIITKQTKPETKLNSSWDFYFHDPTNDNWDRKSFYKLYSIKTIEGFWNIFNAIKNDLHHGMFFLMRDKVFPLWEDDANKNGGYISYKMKHKDFIPLIETLFISMLSEQVLNKECSHDFKIINGVSISPKKEFCIVRIWLRNMKYSSLDFYQIDTSKAFIKKQVYMTSSTSTK